jgi:hypothetical protein
LVVVAVAALDAVGADKTAAKPPDDLVARVAECLRDRGVAVPALSSEALMRWLDTHEPPDAIARACKAAVAPPGMKGKPTDDVRKIAACLRAHGVTPPSAPDDLKRWIIEHKGDAAVTHALKECGMGPPPSCGDKDEQGAAPAEGNKDGQT